MGKLASDLLYRHRSIRAKVDQFLDYWQELAEIFLPNKAAFSLQRQAAERHHEDIFDGKPRQDARDLASAIDGLVFSEDWISLGVEDDALNENDTVKRWLEAASDRLWRVMHNDRAGFVQRRGETNEYLTVFGHGLIWIGERRDRTGLLFRTYHLRDFGFEESPDGEINALALDDYLTAQQAVDKFGAANLHPEILHCLKNDKEYNKRWQFSQLVLPREDYDGDRIGPRGMAFTTAVLDVKHEDIVPRTEGGFHEFPAAVPRWATQPGSCYGRSVAMLALPDALTLQAMGKTLLVGGERAVDPPIMVPSDAMVSPLRTFPGGISVFDPSFMQDSGLNSPIFPFPVSTNLPLGREMQFDYRQMIEAAFFKNVMRLPIESRQMTATEILERKEEFVRVLGPTFGRLQPEYPGAIAKRCLALIERAGALPPRPEELEDVELIPMVKSPLTAARKAIQVAGFSRSLEVITPLAAAQPEILDNFDGDEIVRDMPEAFQMPEKWLKPREAVEKIREGRAEQMAAAAAVESAAPVAGAIKDVATAQSQLDVGGLGGAPI
jgi:hypothetical protein